MVTLTELPPILRVAPEALERLCKEFHVRELSVFGSALHADFGPDSDVDLLVEFDETKRIGLMALLTFQERLGSLFGRRVDLVPKPDLKPRIRQEVLSTRRLLYAA